MRAAGTRARPFIGVDLTLLTIVIGLVTIGHLALHSAASQGATWHLTQLGWVVFGGVVATGVAVIDFRFYERHAYLFYAIVMAMLLLVLFVGVEKNNATRWLDLGFLDAQPSELMKVAIVLVAARFLHERTTPGPRTLTELTIPFAMAAAAVVLVAAQPDLGTGLVILVIFMTVLLFEGIRRGSLVILVWLSLALAPLVWEVGMHGYQQDRVTSFFAPEGLTHLDAWQVNQAVVAVASGGWTGLGHGLGSQVQHGFVPENENDFVFAHVGEEYGFIGGAALLLLYAVLILWSLRIARYARDKFGVLLAVGIAALFFWHVLINIGMVLGLLPVVGLWLPFVSLGGSSVLTVMICVGLLMNLSIRRHVFQQ